MSGEPVCVFCRESLADTPVEKRAEGWLRWVDDPAPPMEWVIWAHPKCAEGLRFSEAGG